MGLFDSFFKPKKPAVPPERLREMLFAAIEANDRPRLAGLCDAHHDAILREFPRWKTAPPGIRQDNDALRRFGHCMAMLAMFFDRERGEPELLRFLIGREEENPIPRWEKGLRQAEALMKEVRFPEAIALLSDLLIDFHPLLDVQGNVVASNLPLTYGHLGVSYFQTGRADKAVGSLEQALELCRRHGDAQGAIAHLGNLFEAHRYLGQSGPAADYAERLADAMTAQGNAGQAAWVRKQAAVVRAGEPLVRMVAEANDQRYELSELDAAALRPGVYVSFVFYRNRTNLRPALHWVRQADVLEGQGRFEEAVAAYQAAAVADRFDPHPHYRMGADLLYLRRYGEAVAGFERAEELAPGWFMCRRYLWLARRLAEGRLDHDTLLTLQALDDERQDRTPEAKAALARGALEKTPDVAWLSLALGRNLNALKRGGEAAEAFRRGLDRAEEPDVRSSLLIELAAGQPAGSPERASWLEEARSLNGNLMAAAMAGLLLKHDRRAAG
jgi:tetratricopeptide (TPR) repeat protein